MGEIMLYSQGLSTQINYHQGHFVTYSWCPNRVNPSTVHEDVVVDP